MNTRDQRTLEAEFVLKIDRLSTEELKELLDFMEWLKASKRTEEEINAEMERRQAIK
jgi:hypothetical protein